jgi:hypothetical protein
MVSERYCALSAARARLSLATAMIWSNRYQRIVEACASFSCGSALIDGEVIVQNKKGVSDFAALRAAIDREPHRLVMLAFDLLFLNGAVECKPAPASPSDGRTRTFILAVSSESRF